MHALHRILVQLSDNWRGQTDVDADSVRQLAIDRTEDFVDLVYDWRETDTAGRWAGEYPENVIFAKDDIDKFIAELETAADHQEQEKNHCLGEIKRAMGSAFLDDIVFGRQTHMSAYYFNLLAKMVYGEYCFDSMFYNTSDYDSIINKNLIEEVKEHPDDWAMVFFDYHY